MMTRFLFALILISTSFGQWIGGPVTIEDGGQAKLYEVACDELQCRPADGSAPHPLLMGDLKTVEGILVRAGELATASGSRFDLVLYEVGRKRSKAGRRVLTRQVLVSGDDLDGDGLAEEFGAVVSRPDYAPGYLMFIFPEAGDSLRHLAALRSRAGVTLAEPVLAKKRWKKLLPNDPRFAYSAGNRSYQWHLRNTGQNGGVAGVDVNVVTAWDLVTGSGVKIGIVDDGLETAHPDLAPNVDTTIDHNWNSGSAGNPTPTDSFDDHGTSCAGVAAAKGGNSIGVSGVAPDAGLVGLRLIAEDVSDAVEAEAMNWRNDVIQVKNNSWGPDDSGDLLEDAGPLTRAAFKNAAQSGRGGLGTVFVWAAGNGGEGDNVNFDGYANSIYTIAVGAVNDRGERARYSEPGAAKVISAPSDGDGIYQGITTTTLTGNGSYTDEFGGTSSATPVVSGVVALMLEANPNLGWRDVQEILIASARKIQAADEGWHTNGGGFHFHHDFGAGLVDATAAVTLAASWENLAPQTSQPFSRIELGLAIPDDDSEGVEVAFDNTSPSELRVEQVNVTVDISHASRGDLEISLISPTGTISRLTELHSDSNEDYSNWRLMSVHHWGESSRGVWRVRVVDAASEDLGVVNSVSVEFFGAPFPAATEAPVFSNVESIQGNVGSELDLRISVSQRPETITVATLPSGLVYDPATRRISGTPTTEGTSEVALTATNAIGTTEFTLTIVIGPRIPTPPVIEPNLAAVALLGQVFEYDIPATNSPTGFAVVGLPAWLVLDATTGRLTGTPPEGGEVSLAVSATNADGTGSSNLTIQIADPLADPLAIALDTTQFVFELSGDAEWFPQSETVFQGGTALRSGGVGNSEEVVISTTVVGPGTLGFHWKVSSEAAYDELLAFLDGQIVLGISGEVDWQRGGISIPPGSHLVSWIYRKDSSDRSGSDEGWLDRVTFVPGVTDRGFEESIDYRRLVWQGREGWKGQSSDSHDGEDAIVSEPISDDQKQALSTTVTGPGTLTFSWKVSSEAEYDFFQFSTNGQLIEEISGSTNWASVTYLVPAGQVQLEWCYAKDDSTAAGADRGWLDEVLWRPNGAGDLEVWQGQNLDPEVSLADDPDGDGRDNLLEYALNSDPLIAGAENGPAFLAGPNSNAFTYRADLSKTEISYRISASTDLVTWSPVPETIISTTWPLQIRRFLGVNPPGKRYFRLEILRVP